jgi:hypothetical protein
VYIQCNERLPPSRDRLLHCHIILLAVTRIKHSPSEVILKALNSSHLRRACRTANQRPCRAGLRCTHPLWLLFLASFSHHAAPRVSSCPRSSYTPAAFAEETGFVHQGSAVKSSDAQANLESPHSHLHCIRIVVGNAGPSQYLQIILANRECKHKRETMYYYKYLMYMSCYILPRDVLHFFTAS